MSKSVEKHYLESIRIMKHDNIIPTKLLSQKWKITEKTPSDIEIVFPKWQKPETNRNVEFLKRKKKSIKWQKLCWQKGAKMNNDSMTANFTEVDYGEHSVGTIISLSIAYGLLSLTAFVGNFIVIWIICKSKKVFFKVC